MMRNSIFIFFLIILFAGCAGDPGEKKESVEEMNPTADTLIKIDTADVPEENISEPQQTLSETTSNEGMVDYSDFVLYVPADAPSPVPVVYIFDPHADGNLPVGMYKTLADVYGFALAGSMLSQNGQTIEEGLQIFSDMRSEVSRIINTDNRRMYVMGFSGGARAAFYFALEFPDITAVIGAGAGFPQANQITKRDFSYIGMVGNADFNLNEMLDTERKLSKSGFSTALITFDGGHHWPPPDVMQEAFLILNLNAMKSGTLAADHQLIAEAYDMYNEKIAELRKAERHFGAEQLTGRAINVLDGLADTESFGQISAEIRQNPEYNRQLKERVSYLQKEMGRQYVFMTSFTNQDLNWWQTEVQKLFEPAEVREEELMNKRLISYLGLLAYMMTNRAVQENNLEAAEKGAAIYRLVEPLNPEHAYLSAVIRMKRDDHEGALKFLEQAVMLGFSDRERMFNEPAFAPISNREEFRNLL